LHEQSEIVCAAAAVYVVIDLLCTKRVLGRLGGVLGRLGGVLGRLGGVLGRLGGVLGRLGRVLGRLGSVLGIRQLRRFLFDGRPIANLTAFGANAP
jgi:hypothetical protein